MKGKVRARIFASGSRTSIPVDRFKSSEIRSDDELGIGTYEKHTATEIANIHNKPVEKHLLQS